eukprot:TRINITY_DN6273_c0_g1_i1.p1 TRINITY_DN6273_c0_g1~~TRINITY_DN6273_c0_g1_i1.p1  ORF type:complete len:340 (+),score=32.44 TRINITY_DN6273_c0_g1_i1:43-1062(+)
MSMLPYYGYPYGHPAPGQPPMGSAWGAPVSAAPPQGGSPPTSWHGAASAPPPASAHSAYGYPYGGYYGYGMPHYYGYPSHMPASSAGGPPPDYHRRDRDRSRSRSPRPRMPHPVRKRADGKPGKFRMCALFNSNKGCARGSDCRFAHSRDELDTSQLLTPDEENLVPDALTDEFWVYKFKCFWCPIGFQHKWMECPYAHNYQDARRDPRIGYGPKLCPTWKKSNQRDEYARRCPNGIRCPFAHGAKEHLYHPAMFRTGNCNDLKGNRCPRGLFCAFYHDSHSQRHPPPIDYDYNTRLPEADVDKDWADTFQAPAYAPGDGTYDPRKGEKVGKRDRSLSP